MSQALFDTAFVRLMVAYNATPTPLHRLEERRPINTFPVEWIRFLGANRLANEKRKYNATIFGRGRSFCRAGLGMLCTLDPLPSEPTNFIERTDPAELERQGHLLLAEYDAIKQNPYGYKTPDFINLCTMIRDAIASSKVPLFSTIDPTLKLFANHLDEIKKNTQYFLTIQRWFTALDEDVGVRERVRHLRAQNALEDPPEGQLRGPEMAESGVAHVGSDPPLNNFSDPVFRDIQPRRNRRTVRRYK